MQRPGGFKQPCGGTRGSGIGRFWQKKGWARQALGEAETWGAGSIEVCRRAPNSPELPFPAWTAVENALAAPTPPPPAQGRIICFSNSGRAGAGSAQPLPVSAGGSGAQRSAGSWSAGLDPGQVSSLAPGPEGRSGRCWLCRSSGGWAW